MSFLGRVVVLPAQPTDLFEQKCPVTVCGDNSSLSICQNKKPTRSHSRRTSSSANCLQVIKLSIQTAPPQLAPPFQPAEHTDAMDNNMEIDTARSPEPHHLNGIRGWAEVSWGLENMWDNYAPDGNSIKRQLPKIRDRPSPAGPSFSAS
jgi:hypothetical protein